MKYDDKLAKKVCEIKDNVEDSENFFSENRKRFKADKKFVFDTTLNASDISTLSAAGRPMLEMNIVKPFETRLITEFSKQVPDLFVSGSKFVNPNVVDLVEGFIRSKFYQSSYRYKASRAFVDSTSGGFGALKVYLDYENDSSLDKDIFIDYVNPLLCGFDPMATDKHKGDGEFCYELIPFTKEKIKNDYPDFDFSKASKLPLSGIFSWRAKDSYTGKDIYYLADYYEKHYKRVTFYQINDPEDATRLITIKKSDYNKEYMDPSFAPKVHKTETRSVCVGVKRYKFIGDQMVGKPEFLKHRCLPLIFVDGLSVDVEGKQKTQSYISDAKDAQRVANITYSATMYEILTMRQSDVFIADVALPEEPEFIKAYNDPSVARSAFVHKAFDEQGKALPAPQVVGRGQINPTIVGITENQIKHVQNILGSYEAQMAAQNNLSGKAITKASINTSSAAAPYIESFMESLQQIGRCMIEMLPIYFTSTRDVPYLGTDGVDTLKTVNDSNEYNTMMDFNPDHLGVRVVAGVNFEVQRQESLAMIINLMRDSEGIRDIIETEALPILFDNVEIRDRAKLVELSREYMQKKKEAMSQQPNPQQIQMQMMQEKLKNDEREIDLKAKKLEIEAQEAQVKSQIEIQKLFQSKKELEAKLIEIQQNALTRLREAQTSEERTAAQMLIEESKEIREQERHEFNLIKDVAQSHNI